jgi:hypothetical protein
MIEMDIPRAFRQIGLTFHAIDNTVGVDLDEIRVGKSPGFQEL